MLPENSEILKSLYELVHNGEIPFKAISEKLDIKPSYLARSVLEGDSGCNFPLHWLIPLMLLTKNFNPLKVIADSCGLLIIEPPKKVESVVEVNRGVHGFQKEFCEMIAALIEFVNDQSVENRKTALDSIKNIQGLTEVWKRRVDGWGFM